MLEEPVASCVMVVVSNDRVRNEKRGNETNERTLHCHGVCSRVHVCMRVFVNVCARQSVRGLCNFRECERIL